VREELAFRMRMNSHMNYQWRSCKFAGPMLPGYEDREISEHWHERAKSAPDVFCYPQVDSWRETLWGLLSDYLTAGVKAAFVDSPPEYIVSDDLSWLDEIVFEATGKVVDIKQLTADRMRAHYRGFRAVHGTRTDDLAPFYRNGLRILRSAEIEDRARSIFLNGRFRHASEERLQEAIRDVDARNEGGGREGRLWLCADERNLTTRPGSAGHYLVYGSEYLYCLGIRVATTRETKEALKSVGRPTVLVCDVPMQLMRSATLPMFAGLILEYMFCELIDDLQAHALSPGSGSGFSIPYDLPADWIVGHYHPENIHDPM